MLLSTVFKFGGAALADGPGIRRAVEIVRSHLGSESGVGAERRLLVVVSAHAGVTDLLETVAAAAADGHFEADRVRIRHRTLLSQLELDPELLDRHLRELYQILGRIQEMGRVDPEERDYVLSFGERMSARVVARALVHAGVEATPVDAWDLGLVTDNRYGQARLLDGLETAIREAVAAVPGVPVVTGFLAKDAAGNLTTLGRNGSDLTASILAAAVGAGEIQYWKTVGGILTADPNRVPDARVIEKLSYAEAAEFGLHGAEVLHPGAVEPALRAQVRVRVRSVLTPNEPGTLLEPNRDESRGDVTSSTAGLGPVGLATRSGLVRLVLDAGVNQDASQRRGRLAKLFAVLDRHEVDLAAVQLSADLMSVLVSPDAHGNDLPAAVAELGPEVRLVRNRALVALVGVGKGEGRRQFRASLEALEEAGVDVDQAVFSAGALSQKFVVADTDLEQAAQVLHELWFGVRELKPTSA
jgi:aspartate kinase